MKAEAWGGIHVYDQLGAPVASPRGDEAHFVRPVTDPASRRRPLGGISKRTIDICIASAALVLALPVLLACIALIFVTTGRSAFFAQRRIGFEGREFRCFKLRTMVHDGDPLLRNHLAANPEAAREWRETRKLRRDPRVTRLGRILRKSSIDELPQLINILRGDMSCVGPRPVVPEELTLYAAHAHEYLRARPGLTGLWQVSGRNSIDYAERVRLDALYVTRWSLLGDLLILFRTIFAVSRFGDAA